jgi:hypothetical protein
MNNEEFEKELKEIEQVVNELRIKWLESKATFIPYKPYEVEVPEDIGDYVYINNIGNIYDLNTFTIVEYEKIYKRGLAFKSKEEAEQFDKERILLFKMHKWAEEQNEGWTPNWNDFEEKQYYVVYDYEDKQFYVRFEHYSEVFTKLPYLKSYNLAEQFIEEFGDEIKEVLL